jgi:hypothetical protein
MIRSDKHMNKKPEKAEYFEKLPISTVQERVSAIYKC